MTEWRKILLSPSTPIIRAIGIIDEGSLRIALVVDEAGRLVATVTDGDIRRGILKGIALESPVRLVMNDAPVTARLNDSRESILALMKSTGLQQIPVVDEDRRLAGLQIFNELIQEQRRDNLVVLMAGGVGSRLRPLTDDCPKPLLKVGSKPILETIVESFIEHGFRRFFLAVHYRAEMLRQHFGDGSRWGVEIGYLHEGRPLGTAGPLGLLPVRPDRPVIVMNGDLLAKVNFEQLLEFHREQRADATMCVREYTYQIPYGVARLEDHRLLDIEEKPVRRSFVSAGIYVLEPGALDLIPAEACYDMPELFKEMIGRGFTVNTFPLREYWIDIGRIEDLERAKGEYPEIFG